MGRASLLLALLLMAQPAIGRSVAAQHAALAGLRAELAAKREQLLIERAALLEGNPAEPRVGDRRVLLKPDPLDGADAPEAKHAER